MERPARLRDLIGLVRERNPFQRARLQGLPADPGLAALPPLTKAELVEDQRRHGPFGTNLTYGPDRYIQLHQTSGTTGPPLRVLDTAEDWAWWRAGFARMFALAGVGAGDRVALAFSFGPHVHFWAAKEGAQEAGAIAIPLGGMTTAGRLRTIADVGATVLSCTPTYALRLAEVAVEQGLERALEPIRCVFCTGEPGASLPAVRTRIEDAFGAACLDHAGLTEAGPFGYPCTAGGGLHVDEREFLCEILDPGLQPAAAGERGELVLTPLGRTGFPVLRYRTGDVVVNSPERCPGGHADRWLPGGIVGRTDDMVTIRGMNVYPSAVEEAVRGVSSSGEFRITYSTERSGLDEIKLEVELSDGGAARSLQEVMRQQLGLRVRVVPVTPGILPRSEGKARRVVDERRGWAR
jgi:phenylacetate-CoA ligase